MLTCLCRQPCVGEWWGWLCYPCPAGHMSWPPRRIRSPHLTVQVCEHTRKQPVSPTHNGGIKVKSCVWRISEDKLQCTSSVFPSFLKFENSTHFHWLELVQPYGCCIPVWWRPHGDRPAYKGWVGWRCSPDPADHSHCSPSQTPPHCPAPPWTMSGHRISQQFSCDLQRKGGVVILIFRDLV